MFLGIAAAINYYSLETDMSVPARFQTPLASNANTLGLEARSKFTDRPTVTYSPLSGRLTVFVTNDQRSTRMLKTSALLFAITVAYVAGAADAAVVYCTAPGIPAGCVVRPVAPAMAAAAKVAYCTAPGVPVGCVAKPAAAATAATAKAIYCTAPGVPVGCVARPAATAATVTPGVGAPGRGVVDPGINQPGALGNRGGGAPGVGVVDPGVNQPGAVGNRGGAAVHPGVGAPEAGVNNVGTNGPGVANQNGGVNRAGRR